MSCVSKHIMSPVLFSATVYSDIVYSICFYLLWLPRLKCLSSGSWCLKCLSRGRLKSSCILLCMFFHYIMHQSVTCNIVMCVCVAGRIVRLPVRFYCLSHCLHCSQCQRRLFWTFRSVRLSFKVHFYVIHSLVQCNLYVIATMRMTYSVDSLSSFLF